MTGTVTQGTSGDKMREALSLLREAAKDTKDDVNDLLAGKYKELRTTVSQFEKRLVKRERELVKQGRKQLHDVARSVDKRVHNNQWQSLGWVVVGGLVVGYMLGRKSS